MGLCSWGIKEQAPRIPMQVPLLSVKTQLYKKSIMQVGFFFFLSLTVYYFSFSEAALIFLKLLVSGIGFIISHWIVRLLEHSLADWRGLYYPWLSTWKASPHCSGVSSLLVCRYGLSLFTIEITYFTYLILTQRF